VSFYFFFLRKFFKNRAEQFVGSELQRFFSGLHQQYEIDKLTKSRDGWMRTEWKTVMRNASLRRVLDRIWDRVVAIESEMEHAWKDEPAFSVADACAASIKEVIDSYMDFTPHWREVVTELQKGFMVVYYTVNPYRQHCCYRLKPGHFTWCDNYDPEAEKEAEHLLSRVLELEMELETVRGKRDQAEHIYWCDVQRLKAEIAMLEGELCSYRSDEGKWPERVIKRK
jgi:hypothetical protein